MNFERPLQKWATFATVIAGGIAVIMEDDSSTVVDRAVLVAITSCCIVYLFNKQIFPVRKRWGYFSMGIMAPVVYFIFCCAIPYLHNGWKEVLKAEGMRHGADVMQKSLTQLLVHVPNSAITMWKTRNIANYDVAENLLIIGVFVGLSFFWIFVDSLFNSKWRKSSKQTT